MHQVIRIQTSGLAVDPAVASEVTPAPLSHGPGAHGEDCLIQLSTDKKICEEVQVSIKEVTALRCNKKVNKVWMN